MKKNRIMATTLASLLASTAVQWLPLPSAKAAKKSSSNKIECKGVATKWVNDCSANGHSCGGKAQANFDANEWLKMSQGDCKAIQAALKNPAVKKYVEMVQKGTAGAIKRGKKL